MRIKLAFVLLLLPTIAYAQSTTSLCYKVPGSPNSSCQSVTSAAPLPIQLVGGLDVLVGATGTDTGVVGRDSSGNYLLVTTSSAGTLSPPTTSGITVWNGVDWGTSLTDNHTNWDAGFSYRLTSATATSPLTLNLSANALTGSILQASSTQNGYLSSNDWTTFNNKGNIAASSTGNWAYYTATGTTVGGQSGVAALDTLTSASSTGQGVLSRVKGGLYALLTQQPIYAELYGLTGTDASVNFQAAIDDAHLLGRPLVMPAGTVYAVGTYYSNTKIKGQGMFLSTLKTPAGKNLATLTSTGAAALWGTDSTGGVGDVEITDMTIDGNMTNNSAGDCLDFYGFKPRFENLLIKNCKDYGLRTEWAWGGEDIGGMEPTIKHVVIDTTGKHGWYFAGTHDGNASIVNVIDAGQTTNKTYAGIYVESKNFFGDKIHTWTRSGSNATLWGLQEVSGNVHLEGGMFEEPILLKSNGNVLNGVDIAVYNGGATNSVYPLVMSASANNHINAQISCTGTNPIYGMKLGESGNLTGQNNINVTVSGCRSGVADMTYSNGSTQLHATGWDIGDQPSVTGTPADSDIIKICSSDWSNCYQWDGNTHGNNLIVGTATNSNVIVGDRGGNITTGSYNTIFGYLGGESMTNAINNTFVGFQSGQYQRSSDSSVAVGLNALRGYSATPGTGYYHTAVGTAALEKVQGETTGNTAVGYLAGNTITTGNGNTVVGYNVATTTLTTGSNNILIGTSSSTDTTAAGSSNQINIGNTLFANSTGGADFEIKGTAPTVASGTGDCGTSPAIAGNNNVMKITVGSSTNGAKCTVTFNSTVAWTNQPVCTCNNNTSAARPVYALVSSTTTFSATASGTLTAGDIISCQCFGYR